MSTIFALFSNASEAGEALRAVANAELGDSDARLVSEWTDEDAAQYSLHSVSNPVSEMAGQEGPRARPTPEKRNEGSGDVGKFFSKSLEKGGTDEFMA